MEFLSPWHRAIAAIAVAKVLVALAIYGALFTVMGATASPRDLRFISFIVVFSFVAVLLMTAGRRDLRAAVLGMTFLLTAAVFSDSAIVVGGLAAPDALAPFRLLFAFQVDAFTAYFLWYFVQEFPRRVAFGQRRRVPQIGIRVAATVGVILFAVNLLDYGLSLMDVATGRASSIVRRFSRRDANSLYWPAQYALSLAGLAVLVWKSRNSPAPDRRRVSLLIGGLVAGTAPSVVWTLLATASPSFRRAVPLSVAAWIVYPTLLATPFTTAYAVLVHQALNVRLVIRRAIQYAAARYSVIIIAAIPAVILLVQLYSRRGESISSLTLGAAGPFIALLVLLAALSVLGSRPIMNRIDRRFFREQYDARRILADLVSMIGTAPTREALAETLRVQLANALHPEEVDVLITDAMGDELRSVTGRSRPLAMGSPLAARLGTGAPLEVDLARNPIPFQGINDDARNWLADTDARLLIPLHSAAQSLVGALVLGEKRSELPYSSEDILTLRSVAATAGIAFGGMPATGGGGEASSLAGRQSDARVCVACGLVTGGSVAACERCGGVTASCPIPRLIAGKFQIDERIGEGGMGVVYRGHDLSLGRLVAVKTLPKMSADRAVRLRREARAMAAISHPNLTVIYATESWNNVPILVAEYLAGETLADLIRRGPVPRDEALRIGIALASVTDALHTAGILHRDIKPRNVGFAADGTPKLLDFGLARLLSEAQMPTHAHTTEGHVVGTPAYLSPEAIAGETPDPSFDLWSISVVLFEAIAGVNPVRAATAPETLDAIRNGRIARLDTVLPDADADLVRFFSRALSPRIAERPRTAASLMRELSGLLEEDSARAA